MEQFLKSALNRASEPLVIIRADRTCLFFNRALASFLGIPAEPQDFNLLLSAWPTLVSISLQSGEVEVLVKGARAEALSLRVKIECLSPEVWLIRPQIETELSARVIDFHAERLQTLGMLAGGVAHDFNNILAGILGHTTYLKTILPSAGKHSDSLRAVEDGAKKASTIIQQILNFSRLDSIEHISCCDLGAIVQRTCTLLRGAIPPDFDLQVNLPAEPVQVLGGEAKIAQILVNLVVNARDALSAGGVISVTISTGKSKNSDVEMGLLEVRDDGQGMSAHTLQRAFEPYFSTKKDSGTGLGLATVHAIVEQFGGSIDVSSALQLGTTFTICLPLATTAERVAARAQIDESNPLRSRGGERILIVDDESPVRNVLSLSLEHLGYEVAISSSGMEAIERYEKNAERFDLVILDMLMPNLSGEEVFFLLKEIDPNLRALIISGYSSEEAVQHILNQGGRGFIQKPFTISELSRKVRICLA
jgi:signal transduction histidine kinase